MIVNDSPNVFKMDRDEVGVSGDSDVELLGPQPKHAKQVAQTPMANTSLSGKERREAYKEPVTNLVDASATTQKYRWCEVKRALRSSNTTMC